MDDQKAIVRYDEALLQRCRHVFGGDIVSRAWVATYDGGCVTEARARLDQVRYGAEKPLDRLRFDGVEIIVEFYNGKRVLLSSSELGEARSFHGNLDVA